VVIQELHAAIFYIEQARGDIEREHLATLTRLGVDRRLPETATTNIRKLSSLGNTSPERSRELTEELRAFFSDWRCLPTQVHEDFHAALPD